MILETYENKLPYNKDSIELLLCTAKDEYENENSRTSVIDTKTSITLPIISAYFLALVPMNDFKSIFSFNISTYYDCIVPTLLFISYITSLILAFMSVLKMVKVINTQSYNIIKPRDLYDNDYLMFDSMVISIKLINLYIEATENNKFVNDKRIPLYKKGLLLAIVSIILFVIYILFKNFFV